MAKKFLDDVELGSEVIRAAVVEFMPYSFAAVNAQSKRFLEVGLIAHCLRLCSSCATAAAAPPCAGLQMFFSTTIVFLFGVISATADAASGSTGGKALQLHHPQNLPGADQAVQERACSQA